MPLAGNRLSQSPIQVNHLVLQQEAKLVHSKVIVFCLISAQQFECRLGSSIHAHNDTISH